MENNELDFKEDYTFLIVFFKYSNTTQEGEGYGEVPIVCSTFPSRKTVTRLCIEFINGKCKTKYKDLKILVTNMFRLSKEEYDCWTNKKGE